MTRTSAIEDALCVVNFNKSHVMFTPVDSHKKYFYLIFAISGFSGLIYESIWSQYLKLFLGHAAYAQTLVLAIFMGGMALGAWVPSRYGVRWKNLLIRYAIVEAIIGICAIAFHQIFIGVTDFAFDSVVPALASAWAVSLFKWTLAAGLILPQSVLLGMTFPLMSAGIIRRFQANSGASLATLYFANSFGAAIGVLVSGFVLINTVGLPGTILTAGLINVVLALAVWMLAKGTIESELPDTKPSTATDTPTVPWKLLIAVSFLTGAASFIYEIGWIRMLSLVLGTSTHAFELMLSAFIFGLAFGGLWMRRRIDDLSQPVRYLGWIQIIMGLIALGTLVAYNFSFDLMRALMGSLAANDGGYFIFNLGSHGIAMLLMAPVTFCAGMTLPLITHTLIRRGYGEKSIGAVYAANTLGAIAGVLFAVHIGFSTFGLKGLISFGAGLDMALGILLFALLPERSNRRELWVASLIAASALAFVIGGVELDRYKMASGVFRHGHLYSADSQQILFHKDGKTATIDLIRDQNGIVSIKTNGKTDAALSMNKGVPATADESTMILLGGIPLLLRPNARTAAVIGMGSGLTTQILLTSKKLDRVDTIEIEPVMIEAARGFRPRVEAPFSDPRSHFHIDDAKTFFSANQSRYDIIVSEPSNPWVSGVSGLFTDEFYRRAKTHLNPNGVFIQWIHVYEIDFNLIASVMKAIALNFSDYRLYAASDDDILIAAVKTGKTPPIHRSDWEQSHLAAAFRNVEVNTFEDLKSRYIGDRAVLEPLFAETAIAMNSDYFPVLDLNAARARFLRNNATELTLLRAHFIPALEILSGERPPRYTNPPTASDYYQLSQRARSAIVMRNFYTFGRLGANDVLDPALLRHLFLSLRLAENCGGSSTPGLWLESVNEVMKFLIPHLDSSGSVSIWRRLRKSNCYPRLQPIQKDVFQLFGATARRDGQQMAILAERLLESGKLSRDMDSNLLGIGILGYLTINQPDKARLLWMSYARRALGSRTPDMMLRLLVAHIIHRDKNYSQ